MIGVEIEVMIIDGGQIHVKHSFYGRTEAEARGYLERHKESCSYFKSNYEAGNMIELVDDDMELPEPDDFEDEDE